MKIQTDLAYMRRCGVLIQRLEQAGVVSGQWGNDSDVRCRTEIVKNRNIYNASVPDTASKAARLSITWSLCSGCFFYVLAEAADETAIFEQSRGSVEHGDSFAHRDLHTSI